MGPLPGSAGARGRADPPGAAPRREHDASGELRDALETVLMGMLARLEPRRGGDPSTITDAFRQSIALGEAYAGSGRSASGLIEAYLELRERLAGLLPPHTPADEPWARQWQQRVDRAVDNFLKVGLQAFERQRVAGWERQAHVDGATRVYNRSYFERRFLDEIRRAERYQRPVTVMVADPGRMEADTAADSPRERLARLSGRALERILRHVDLVTRCGHELVALLPDTTLGGGRTAAERVLHAAQEEAAAFGLDPGALRLAIGLATYPDHGRDSWTLLAAADHALYRAKHTGCGLAVP